MTDTPSFARTFGELDAGALEAQASHAMREIATAIRDLDGQRARSALKGRLTIDLRLELAKGSGQVLVTHTLKFTRPTQTGTVTEDTNGDTLVYVGRRGALTVMPETQMSLGFSTTHAKED